MALKGFVFLTEETAALRHRNARTHRAASGAAGAGITLQHATNGPPHVSSFNTVHIRVASRKPFEALRSALEAQLGPWQPQEFARFTEAQTPKEFEAATQSLTGPSGFMTFFIADHSHYYSRLFGESGGRVVMFVIGNASIARHIVGRHPEAGLYVPLRIAVYENAAGTGELAYDLPSSLLAQFGDEGTGAIARDLDAKLEKLAAAAAG